MQKIADALIRWLISSGLFNTLSTLATNTTLIRRGVLIVATWLATHGAIFNGLTTQFWIGIAVAGVTTLLDVFINYVRNKYAKELQQAVNAVFPIDVDKFIGPGTIKSVQSMATNRVSGVGAERVSRTGTI